MNVILTIDKVHTAPHKAINIFTRCTIRNQFDILLTGAGDVSERQTYMPCQGEDQTLTKKV